MRAIEAAILSPDVCGIVVSGAAGVGKSRIAREALSAAASHGCEGRWTVGTSAARMLPLGAFAAWAQSGVSDTVQLVRGVLESLTSAPPGIAVVVGVDDVHLLDALSTFVVEQIVQRAAAKVVLTMRDGEPVPAAVREIWRDDRFDRLDLQPLSPEETSALLAATLGGAVDHEAAVRLWTMTRGNVLYLRNIVEREVADGRLEIRHGSWRWTGEPVVAPGLAELIESRIGDLPAPVADVIDAVAVGEPIELTALIRIAGRSAVEEADSRGLIAVESADHAVEVRVAHPLYGEVRRRRAALTRLRRLRGLVAGELAVSDDPDDIRLLVRRATLSLDSDLAPDPDVFVKAAHGAVGLADLSLAERLADAAVRAGAGPEASFIRAHALSWLSRGDEADSVLAGMPAAELTAGDRARSLFLRASNMLWVLADPDRAAAIIDGAADQTSPEARCYLDAFRTVYRFAMDDPRLAILASENLRLNDLPGVVAAEVAWALASISADAGRTTEAVGVADAGYALAARSFDAPQMRFNIADAHVSALLLSGRIPDAADVAEQVRREAADLPGTAHLLGPAVAGRVALGAGRLDAACVSLEHSASALADNGYAIGWGYRYHVARAIALAMRGFTEEAATALAELDTVVRPFRSLDYERSLARAWVSAGQGAISEAVSGLLTAAEKARAKDQFAAEVFCLQTAAQFGDRTVAPRLRELEAIVEGPRVGLAARLAEALRDGDASELAALSEDFERIGDVVAAVDAAAHAAIGFRRRGLRGSELRCSTRANALAEQCGDARTPALRRTCEKLPLTDREREIVGLIAAGLSSRAVAERLTLSVRTVESHLYRAMAKTGTTKRDEIARLLPRQEPRT
ncbi:LuxR C-terminal-related transcriptional regulator [Mycobacterium sp. LTG2003]